jgi:DUF438 domain-containing protein
VTTTDGDGTLSTQTSQIVFSRGIFNGKVIQIFAEVFEKADYIGCDLTKCHPPGATKKVKKYFKEYETRTRDLDYYIVDEPSGKVTIVNVPFYDGETFKGVVEFIFESSLT